MSKKRIVNIVINIILTVIYVPLSFFGFFMLMGTDGLIDETNQLILTWTYIFCYAGFFMFAICAGSMVLGNILYKKNRFISGIIVRFIPVMLILLAVIIDTVIYSIA